MRPREDINRLRAALAKAGLETQDRRQRVALGHDAADRALKGGLARGALHEIFAHPGHETAATGFASVLCARLAGAKPILWIRHDYCALEFGELAATGLLELGIDPQRFILLRAAHVQDALKAASDALACAALGSVVIELSGSPRILDLTASRKLTLSAAATNVPVLLLRFSAEPDANGAETRWRIRGAGSEEQDENWGRPVFEAELIRNRHGNTGCWVMEWCCDSGACREIAADRGAVVPASFDGPAAAALDKDRRTAA
jgi:protein ImuA